MLSVRIALLTSAGQALRLGCSLKSCAGSSLKLPIREEMLTHNYSLCNAAVQTYSNHRLARSEFVHGPNLVSEPFQSLLGPRNAELSSF